MKMKIKFLPQNIEIDATPEKSLLQLATENQIEIRSICKGVPSCAECRVRIVEGDNNVLPPTKAELGLIGTNYFIDGRRLSCQVRCFGDITVDLTEQIEKSEHQTKKIRGFRTSKHMESKAVNDTLLLDEKDQLESAPSSSTGESAKSSHSQAKKGEGSQRSSRESQKESGQKESGRGGDQRRRQHRQGKKQNKK